MSICIIRQAAKACSMDAQQHTHTHTRSTSNMQKQHNTRSSTRAAAAHTVIPHPCSSGNMVATSPRRTESVPASRSASRPAQAHEAGRCRRSGCAPSPVPLSALSAWSSCSAQPQECAESGLRCLWDKDRRATRSTHASPDVHACTDPTIIECAAIAASTHPSHACPLKCVRPIAHALSHLLSMRESIIPVFHILLALPIHHADVALTQQRSTLLCTVLKYLRQAQAREVERLRPAACRRVEVAWRSALARPASRTMGQHEMLWMWRTQCHRSCERST
jgi:hypothetical protein